MKRKDYIALAIAFILGALILLFLPAANGLTENGVKLLAVFIPTMFLWLFCDTSWSSLLSATALAALGVMKGDTVFMTLWGNNVCVRVICLAIITQAMTAGGATKWIAKWFISRKIVHGRPYVFMFLVGLVCSIIGIVVSSPIIILLFADLIDEVSISIGYTRKDKFYKASMLVAFWCACWSDVLSPFGRSVSSAVIATMENYGYPFTPGDWISYTVPFAIFGILAELLVIKSFYRPDVSKFINYDDEAIRAELRAVPMTRTGKFAVGCVIACVVLWLIPSLTFLPVAVTSHFGLMGTGMAVSLMVCLLCLVPIENGKPAVELGTALAKVPWKLIVFLGMVILYSGQMGADTYGIKTCLVNILGPIAANIPVIGLLVGALVVTIIGTNFMSNTVAASVIVSVLVPILATIENVPPRAILALAVAVGCIADSAACTLAGSVAAGTAFNDNVVPYNEGVKPSIVYSVAITIVACILMLVWGYVF